MDEWISHYNKDSIVRAAFIMAETAHKGVLRSTGDPYFTHCLAVAKTVAGLGLDEHSIAAALLHDTVEDTEITIETIENKFGKGVAFLVDGLTKLKNLDYSKKSAKGENLRKFVLSFAKDLRVVIIKLADRLHNMQTLKSLSLERQQRMAWETTEIYAPIAYRLGMQQLSGELEDLAFPYLHPEENEWLTKAVKDEYETRHEYTKKLVPIVKKLLEQDDIHPIAVDARAKRRASLYKKLLRYEMDLDRVYDLVAVRVIVNTVTECYTALGSIHKSWAPLPNRFRDYIARPKQNGYKSLHTTVFCVDNIITEFQIRTQEMHEENEFGVAAHWGYQQTKSNPKKVKSWLGIGNRNELAWVEQLRNWQSQIPDSEEFEESVKAEFFKDRIYVLTPQNDIIDLPAQSTPVDFAYRIHTRIGNECVGAKVNGNIVPLSHELHSGDVVEIITQKGKKPSESWLSFVKTSLPRKQIRRALQTTLPWFKKETKKFTEFRIHCDDRPGYLKDIGSVFAEHRITITHLTSATDNRRKLSTVTIQCDPLQMDTVEKLMVKIKRVQGTRTVSYLLG